jgi:hypothetical protein
MIEMELKINFCGSGLALNTVCLWWLIKVQKCFFLADVVFIVIYENISYTDLLEFICKNKQSIEYSISECDLIEHRFLS